jgi:hypothetical protein
MFFVIVLFWNRYFKDKENNSIRINYDGVIVFTLSDKFKETHLF